MSRIGREPITVPAGVTVTFAGTAIGSLPILDIVNYLPILTIRRRELRRLRWPVLLSYRS